MAREPIQGLEQVRGARAVGDPRPEETPITPGNLALYDMDGNGQRMPKGIWEFDGNGSVAIADVLKRVFAHQGLGEQSAAVTMDVARWVARRNGLDDHREPIPSGTRIAIPEHELEALLATREKASTPQSFELKEDRSATSASLQAVCREAGISLPDYGAGSLHGASAQVQQQLGRISAEIAGHVAQQLGLGSLQGAFRTQPTAGIGQANPSAAGAFAITGPMAERWARGLSELASGNGLDISATVQWVLREGYLESSKDLLFFAQKVKFFNNLKEAIRNELTRARGVLSSIAGLPDQALVAFLPKEIQVLYVGEAQIVVKDADVANDPLRIKIDGKEFLVPPSAYQTVGFAEAFNSLFGLRELSPTTGGSQGCGSGVVNELVSNAFQFLAVNAILNTKEGGGFAAPQNWNKDAATNINYSAFAAALQEKYGITATPNSADGVGGGSVSLEGGRKVSDGVSDGNLDFKDLEWNEASQVLAAQLGLEVNELFADPARFNAEYGEIAALLSSHDFNPADSDGLVEVLMIASMLENAGKGTFAEHLMTKAELEAYIEGLEEKLASAGDDAQLANVDLQNMLQKQQQIIQMMSNISKMLHDTSLATIRKIG